MVIGRGLSKIFPGGKGFLSKTISAAFSLIIMAAAFIFAASIDDVTNASTPRAPSRRSA